MLHPPRHYIYIDMVARTGSIRKAADALSVASTALNRKIIEIERDLGTPLFERLPRGVRLTAAGEVLLDAIRRGMADLRSAASQIEQLRGLVRGVVRIGCAESVASDLMPGAIARYREQHPRVQFQLRTAVTSALVAALLEDEVDLVLAHDPPPSEALKVIASMRQPLCAMMRPDHPLAGAASLRLSDCQGHVVTLGDPAFNSRRMIDAVLARGRLRLDVALEANAMQTMKEFTLATGAISFQFQIGTLREVRHGELVAIPLSDRTLAQNRLVLACRTSRMLPIAALSFSETLSAALTP
jgi:DNA-binding transcriptional LysR family regulator